LLGRSRALRVLLCYEGNGWAEDDQVISWRNEALALRCRDVYPRSLSCVCSMGAELPNLGEELIALFCVMEGRAGMGWDGVRS
jgi:hypothetical protein